MITDFIIKLNFIKGCKSNQERADKILELLREKGLEGEPTLIKCRELKKQILTKKEIEDLDPSVILNTEGIHSNLLIFFYS